MDEGGPKKPARQELLRRYATIDLGGRKILREADIPTFAEFGEEFNSRFNVWIDFTQGSKDEIRTRITDELERIGRKSGVEFFLAGRDFPLHTSLLQGAGAEDSTRNDASLKKFTQNPGLRAALAEITSAQIPYTYLLIDKKGNIILASTEMPESIKEARKLAAEMYAEEGVAPLPISILHSTIARINNVSTDDGEPALADFRKSLIDLRHRLSADPVLLEIQGAHIALGGVAKGGTSHVLTA